MQTTTSQKVLCITALMIFVFITSARSSLAITSVPRASFFAAQTNCETNQSCDSTGKLAKKTLLIASWYGEKFQSRLTSSGEHFDVNKLTAASKTLPLGTRVKLTAPKTGRSVVVRINDRGPWVKGRDLDLAEAAAIKLGIHDKGVVSLEASVWD